MKGKLSFDTPSISHPNPYGFQKKKYNLEDKSKKMQMNVTKVSNDALHIQLEKFQMMLSQI